MSNHPQRGVEALREPYRASTGEKQRSRDKAQSRRIVKGSRSRHNTGDLSRGLHVCMWMHMHVYVSAVCMHK